MAAAAAALPRMRKQTNKLTALESTASAARRDGDAHLGGVVFVDCHQGVALMARTTIVTNGRVSVAALRAANADANQEPKRME